MMRNRSFTEILDECLDRMLAGGEPIERCLADYPDFAVELRNELEMALGVREAFAFLPDADAKRANRMRMHTALERERGRFRWHIPFARGLLTTGPRIAAAAMVALFALVGTGTGTVLASQSTAPGDVLYPVKRTAERVQLAFAFSDSREAELRTELLDRRFEELEKLTASGRERFVPGLVREIARHSGRVQVLTSGPLSNVVDALPPDPDDQPPAVSTPEPGARPTPPTRVVPERREVSVKPLLEFSEQLERLGSRIAGVEERATTARTRQNLNELKRVLDAARTQLERLLDRTDTIHIDPAATPGVTPEPPRTTVVIGDPGESNDGRESTPTLGPGVTRLPVGQLLAVVRDVRLYQGGGPPRLDVEVEFADGTYLPIQVTRGGTQIVKDGRPAGIKHLKPGVRVRLIVDDAGQVASIVIEPSEEDDELDRRRDELDRA